jgi:hypothetical protein
MPRTPACAQDATSRLRHRLPTFDQTTVKTCQSSQLFSLHPSLSPASSVNNSPLSCHVNATDRCFRRLEHFRVLTYATYFPVYWRVEV